MRVTGATLLRTRQARRVHATVCFQPLRIVRMHSTASREVAQVPSSNMLIDPRVYNGMPINRRPVSHHLVQTLRYKPVLTFSAEPVTAVPTALTS
jgi:hypothetical protein